MSGDKKRVILALLIVIALTYVNGAFLAGFCFCYLWLVYCEKRAEGKPFIVTAMYVALVTFGAIGILFPQIAFIIPTGIMVLVSLGEPKIRTMQRMTNL
jgi:4-amino-4-deoxy-L-arabinose transferase-like glycosyltransferase